MHSGSAHIIKRHPLRWIPVVMLFVNIENGLCRMNRTKWRIRLYGLGKKQYSMLWSSMSRSRKMVASFPALCWHSA